MRPLGTICVPLHAPPKKTAGQGRVGFGLFESLLRLNVLRKKICTWQTSRFARLAGGGVARMLTGIRNQLEALLEGMKADSVF